MEFLVKREKSHLGLDSSNVIYTPVGVVSTYSRISRIVAVPPQLGHRWVVLPCRWLWAA
ncbi:hypothetical protein HMPREF0578_1030 [Mobiluncus mulieris 28-1]|nr:hypothetical protein HMPREF0578_1030 [Mobiluncus mulieris 28-1]